MKLISEGTNFSILLDCPASKIPASFWDLPFNRLVEQVLGKKYFVYVTFVRESKMKEYNRKYRGIDSSTDILSFDLGESFNKDSNYDGEILFSINNVRRKAKEFGQSPAEYLAFLLIHGLLHLKGLEHSSIMENAEKKYIKLLNERLQNNSRDRHRHVPSTGSSSRSRRPKRVSKDTRSRGRGV